MNSPLTDHLRLVSITALCLTLLTGCNGSGSGSDATTPITADPVTEEPVTEEPVTEPPVIEEPVWSAAEGDYQPVLFTPSDNDETVRLTVRNLANSGDQQKALASDIKLFTPLFLSDNTAIPIAAAVYYDNTSEQLMLADATQSVTEPQPLTSSESGRSICHIEAFSAQTFNDIVIRYSYNDENTACYIAYDYVRVKDWNSREKTLTGHINVIADKQGVIQAITQQDNDILTLWNASLSASNTLIKPGMSLVHTVGTDESRALLMIIAGQASENTDDGGTTESSNAIENSNATEHSNALDSSDTSVDSSDTSVDSHTLVDSHTSVDTSQNPSEYRELNLETLAFSEAIPVSSDESLQTRRSAVYHKETGLWYDINDDGVIRLDPKNSLTEVIYAAENTCSRTLEMYHDRLYFYQCNETVQSYTDISMSLDGSDLKELPIPRQGHEIILGTDEFIISRLLRHHKFPPERTAARYSPFSDDYITRSHTLLLSETPDNHLLALRVNDGVYGCSMDIPSLEVIDHQFETLHTIAVIDHTVTGKVLQEATGEMDSHGNVYGTLTYGPDDCSSFGGDLHLRFLFDKASDQVIYTGIR